MSSSTQDKLTRIAIVNTDRCKPKKCRQECKRSCPVVRQGKNERENQKSYFFFDRNIYVKI